jgi:amino acid adenylation domain-containing protein
MAENILQEKIKKSVLDFKDHIVMECGEQRITFGELEKRSQRVMLWLHQKGYEKGTLVGIYMNDRKDFIITLLGILMAGCVCVPMDPSIPRNRIKMMMQSTHTQLIFTDKSGKEQLAPIEEILGKFVLANTIFDEDSSKEKEMQDLNWTSEDKIYLYFTSGSTGTPKAFVGKNKSLLHFINWEIDTFGLEKGVRVSQLTSPGFDAFLRDVFVPLCSGGTIVIPESPEIQMDPGTLAQWIERNRINLIHCVPSIFRLFYRSDSLVYGQEFKELKNILMSGERINPSDLDPWYQKYGERIQLVNLWGTSETTLAKTFYMIRKSDVNRERIPIGKPIRGAGVVVLDKMLKVCSQRIVGELYIRTPFRTFGYCNDPEANDAKFIPNPFTNDPNDLLHRTGDEGRLLPDGNIELLGRIDRQVKIRGIRIELEEIESILTKHPAIREAVVLKQETSAKEEFLAAFLVLKNQTQKQGESDGTVSEEIKEYLGGELPTYMVPTIIQELEKLPRKPNGKIDIEALPDPLENKEEVKAPENTVQERLLDLWQEILGDPHIGVTSHFFRMGGNSLTVMSLISKIHREFDVRIPLGKIFNNPTIEKQADIIINSEEDKYASIQPLEKQALYEVSYAQRRVWILSQLKEASQAFNMPRAFILGGQLNREAFEQAFTGLIKRHEILRTVFVSLKGDVWQKVIEPEDLGFKLNYVDLRNSEDREPQVKAYSKQESNALFDLSKGPLVRATLLHLKEEEYLFLLCMHHIVSDLLSNEIITAEVFALYRAHVRQERIPLKPLKVQYKDYAAWQNDQLKGFYLVKHRDYWIKQFQQEVPKIQLPLDNPRPEIQTYNGDVVRHQVEEKLTRKLKTFSNSNDVTLFMTLLASMNVLLHHYTAETDIVIGIPIAGRQHSDLENQIGFYLNTLALRTRFDEHQSFIKLLEQAREVALGAFEHQVYPFDKLVEDWGGTRDMSRHPLFDVAMDMQNFSKPQMGTTHSSGSFRIEPYKTELKACKFDLTLYVQERKTSLNLYFEYNTDLFNAETIQLMAERFEKLLRDITENPHTRLSEFQLDHPVEIPTLISVQRRIVE